MTERISDEKLTEIRQSVDIVDLIGEYIQLSKKGRNYFGLCPFHGEKSPSFSVSPEKQIYHCFGCGAGGNVFTFLSEQEGLSFVEAARRLADRSNIELPLARKHHESSNSYSDKTNKMIEAHELLRKLYNHILVNTNEGEEALEYLTGRGLTTDIIEQFQIGYALPQWDFDVNFLKGRSYGVELMEEAGLIIAREDSKNYFDRFRNRVIFPIFDVQGKTVGFSGRTLGDDVKYINSPETSIFNKSNLLYNFNFARQEIRKQNKVILFEGFVDVIAAYRAGVKNGVATMGTSLTDDHVTLIRRNCSTVIICFDNDDAGQEASFRAASLLEKSGCKVQICMLPDGYDPDDYVNDFGEERFRNEIIGESLTFVSFKLLYFQKGKNLNNEGDLFSYIETVLKEISTVKNPVERDHYLRQISEQFSIPFQTLVEQQKQIYYARRKSTNRNEQPAQMNFLQQAKSTLTELRPAYVQAERSLLAHMLIDLDVTYKVKQLLNEKMFNVDEHQAIYTYLLGFYEGGNAPNPSSFITYVQDSQLQKTIVEIGMMSISDELGEQELADYIKQVFNYEKMLKIKEKEAERREAELAEDYYKAAVIATEIIKIRNSM